MEFLAAAFELSVTFKEGVSVTRDLINKALEPTASSLLTKLEEMATKRETKGFLPNEIDVDETMICDNSPAILALEKLYTDKSPAGRTYVLYAPSTQGKTTGAKYFLQHSLPHFRDPNGNPLPPGRGILLTGPEGHTDNYLSFMKHIVGAGECKGWVYSLIAALLPDPAVEKQLPSILLLDNFNVDSKENELFLQYFIVASNQCGFYTVIMTQNEKLADKMSAMNHGMKIAPLPGAVTKDSNYNEPEWTALKWNKKDLSQLILLRFPGDFELDDQKEGYAWLEDGMTPSQAIWEAEKKNKTTASPPQKKRKFYDFGNTNVL